MRPTLDLRCQYLPLTFAFVSFSGDIICIRKRSCGIDFWVHAALCRNAHRVQLSVMSFCFYGVKLSSSAIDDNNWRGLFFSHQRVKDDALASFWGPNIVYYLMGRRCDYSKHCTFMRNVQIHLIIRIKTLTVHFMWRLLKEVIRSWAAPCGLLADFPHILQGILVYFSPSLFSPLYLFFSDSCLTASISTPASLIVPFPAEGYFRLQGYENVTEAYSIFSYINSHFPPEQTHFPTSKLPRWTSHFPPDPLRYVTMVMRGKWNAYLSFW